MCLHAFVESDTANYQNLALMHLHMSILVFLYTINQSINKDIECPGGSWDPTDKKFSSMNSYRQNLLPTCKAFPKETTTCIWFTQGHSALLYHVSSPRVRYIQS